MISVVIPTYNKEKSITKTVESILEQDYMDFEIIIVDDCSSDDTVRIVENAFWGKIRLIKLEKNSGANTARNKGVLEARGNYIAFMDSDDVWDKSKLSHCMKYIQETDADVIFHGYRRIFPNGREEILPHYDLNMKDNKLKAILWENCVATPTMLGKSEIFSKILFDEEMPKFQDWELAIRLADNCNLRFLNETLLTAYVENNGLTMNMGNAIMALERIMKKNEGVFKSDNKLSAKYYMLMGDFSDRCNDGNIKSYPYYKTAYQLNPIFRLRIKKVLSLFRLSKPLYKLRKKLRITY